MSVARQFKSETISDLQTSNRALYKLAAPSAPEEAREEAIERSREGKLKNRNHSLDREKGEMVLELLSSCHVSCYRFLESKHT